MLATEVDRTNTSILVSTGAPLSDLTATKNKFPELLHPKPSTNMCRPSSPHHKKPSNNDAASPASKKIKKSVSFHDKEQIRHIRPLCEMLNKERRAIWLSDCDYAEIQEKAKRTVKAIQSGTTKNIDCRRGFENLFTEAILTLTEKQKEQSRSKVLEAQEDGVSAEDLANVSMKLTKEAKERALAAAAMDEDDMRCMVLDAKLKKEREEEAPKPMKKSRSLLRLASFGSSKRRIVFGRATLPRYSLELRE